MITLRLTASCAPCEGESWVPTIEIRTLGHQLTIVLGPHAYKSAEGAIKYARDAIRDKSDVALTVDSRRD